MVWGYSCENFSTQKFIKQKFHCTKIYYDAFDIHVSGIENILCFDLIIIGHKFQSVALVYPHPQERNVHQHCSLFVSLYPL